MKLLDDFISEAQEKGYHTRHSIDVNNLVWFVNPTTQDIWYKYLERNIQERQLKISNLIRQLNE